MLGIAPHFLVNRHGPCPVCGGKDRFRFDDKDGDGWHHCNQCGAGPGIILVRKLNGWDHATACREIDAIIGTEAPKPPSIRSGWDMEADKRRQAIERVLNEAHDPAIVAGYLRSRGISVRSEVLLGHR